MKIASSPRVLLLTQDPGVRELSAEALEGRGGYQLVEVREASMLSPLVKRGVELVIVDQSLPDKALQTVADTLGDLRELPVVVLASGSRSEWHRISRGNPLEAVLEAPFTVAELADVVEQQMHKGDFLRSKLVGGSETIRELRDRILLIAPTPITVLITGESGTGKDVVSRALHHYSTRSEGPLKAVNCAAIPENLIENELFGHEKGAFTDARAQFRGVFEQAAGGTVFLDEIGEMPLVAQVRLLRVLEEREITRIGGDRALPVDVRIVAATNKDLREAVSAGTFRRDLYHRLKVVELYLPPLRQRREDIPVLLEHFVQLVKDEARARFQGFSGAAIDLLVDYEWPGNAREMRNLVDRLVFLGPAGQVEPGDLLPHLEQEPQPNRHLPVVTGKSPDQSERELIYFALLDLKREVADLRRVVEDGMTADGGDVRPLPRPVYQVGEQVPEADQAPVFDRGDGGGNAEGNDGVRPLKDLEREAIEQALRQVDRNRRRAAEMLGIGVRTLYRKLEEYGLK